MGIGRRGTKSVPVTPRRRASPPALERLGVALAARPEETALAAAERPLVGAAQQVGAVDRGALVVEDGGLHRAIEEVLGVAAEELVEGILPCVVNGQPRPGARPAHTDAQATLPGSSHHHGVERPMSIPGSSA